MIFAQLLNVTHSASHISDDGSVGVDFELDIACAVLRMEQAYECLMNGDTAMMETLVFRMGDCDARRLRRLLSGPMLATMEQLAGKE